MTRPPTQVLGAAAIGAAALAAGLLLLWSPWRGLPPGPLGEDPGAPNRIAFDVEVGRPFSYGLVLLRNPDPAPAEIAAVELVGATTGIELVASAVRPLSEAADHGLVANDRAYPPPALAGHLRPALGARIAEYRDPSHAVELILGLRVAAPGTHAFAAVAVRYLVSGTAYRVVFPYALTVCAPPPGGACPEPG